jgi:hypothetical protein
MAVIMVAPPGQVDRTVTLAPGVGTLKEVEPKAKTTKPGPRASEDFIVTREQPPAEEREPL